MKTIAFAIMIITGASALMFFSSIAMSQPASIPHHKVPYLMDTGMFNGAVGLRVEHYTVFREVVYVSGASWLQLHFGDYNLAGRSYITITSLEDGNQQRLDAKSLLQWGNSTAIFNGDAVEVALHVAPEEQGIFFRIEEVTIGGRGAKPTAKEAVNDSAMPETVCGATDDREAATDPRVGRIMPVGCTAWIVSNGAYLTAGHCTGAGMTTLQFHVPSSTSAGVPVAPPPGHQYPIQAGSVRFSDTGQGQDWAIFAVGPNANTGLLPVAAQGAFYRMVIGNAPKNVRVTGYGTDVMQANQTLQTHSGPYQRERSVAANDIFIEYQVDTQPGNSGSPVIREDTTETIGIHTNGGCDTDASEGNLGTSFSNRDLQNAIQNFLGNNVMYVDQGYPPIQGNRDGTIFRLFDTLAVVIDRAPAGSRISIVTGSYNERLTISKSLTLTAPAGPVLIGAQ